MGIIKPGNLQILQKHTTTDEIDAYLQKSAKQGEAMPRFVLCGKGKKTSSMNKEVLLEDPSRKGSKETCTWKEASRVVCISF